MSDEDEGDLHIAIYEVVTPTTRQVKRLAANAIVYELEKQMDADTYMALKPDALHVLQLLAIMDRVEHVETTEPIVRAKCWLRFKGEEDVSLLPHFDIRLRDWAALKPFDPDKDKFVPSTYEHEVTYEQIVPDVNTPLGGDE